VNLSEESIRGPPHNPGTGGWPTIRYFNKDTGLEGANYVKKTDKPMCQELGDEETMTAYIEDSGSTSLCMATTGAGCNPREKSYIDKFKGDHVRDITAQYDRLEKMKGQSMKADLISWIIKRKKILKQLIVAAEDVPNDEL